MLTGFLRSCGVDRHHMNTYRYRSGPQEVKVGVFPKQISLWVGGVKLLSPHDEVAGEVTPCKQTHTFKASSLRVACDDSSCTEQRPMKRVFVLLVADKTF